MTIEVLLFASLRERAGTGNLVLELPEGTCAGEIWGRVQEAFPKLEGGPRPLVAVNEAYASPEATLRDGDRVALLPPVSGG